MTLLQGGAPAGAGAGCPGPVRKFDDWAASYDLSQLQAVLYGPVHDAVLRYARRRVPCPGMILDVGCGTGRLSARLASSYDQAHVVGVDASTAMIQNAAAAVFPDRSRFAVALAERLPFADAVFDLVVVTLSVSHWGDAAAGLAQVSRVMSADGTLVAAGPCAARSSRVMTRCVRRVEARQQDELPALIAACGLWVERVEPIRSVVSIADTVLVAARTPRPRRGHLAGQDSGVGDRFGAASAAASARLPVTGQPGNRPWPAPGPGRAPRARTSQPRAPAG